MTRFDVAIGSDLEIRIRFQTMLLGAGKQDIRDHRAESFTCMIAVGRR